MVVDFKYQIRSGIQFKDVKRDYNKNYYLILYYQVFVVNKKIY